MELGIPGAIIDQAELERSTEAGSEAERQVQRQVQRQADERQNPSTCWRASLQSLQEAKQLGLATQQGQTSRSLRLIR